MKKYNVNDFEQVNFYQMPKWLFNKQYIEITSDTKITYTLLKDRFRLSMKNGWIDGKGNIFLIYTRKELQEMLQCGKEKIAKVMNELIENNLIEEKKQGFGKPNLIYLLQPNFLENYEDETIENPVFYDEIDIEETLVPIENTVKSEKPTSGEHIENTDLDDFRKTQENRGSKNRPQEVRFSDLSNNNIINNNTNINLEFGK